MSKKLVLVVLLSIALSTIACSISGSGASGSSAVAGEHATAEAPAVRPGGNLGEAMNLVTGTETRPSVFPSYHLEVSLNVPDASDDEKSVVVVFKQLVADVQGKNIHVTYHPGSPDELEGYLIGEKEYKVVGGKVVDSELGLGSVGMRWAFWPLEVVSVHAASAVLALPNGQETLEGRVADVYVVDTVANPAERATLKSLGTSFQSFKGTFWIDRETGGLLRSVMDYTMEVSTFDGSSVIGTGEGHMEVTISEIGKVTVGLP